MVNTSSNPEFRFRSAEAEHTHDYLFEPVLAACKSLGAESVFDLGCGNGSLCDGLAKHGFRVGGCDPSESGVAFAKERLPGSCIEVLGVYDDPSLLGSKEYDVVVSTEVVEHLFEPRALPRFATRILRPGGSLIISTPYHGYVKNLALALMGKWDFHHTPLWDGGHIKFWSRSTLTQLLESEGFQVTRFIGAGRFPYLWKSMILIAQKL